MGKIYFGFDPGGKDNFGWAVLKVEDGFTKTGIASNALEAVDAAYEAAKQKPDAVGIDAPLYWVVSSNRKADQYVRKWVCAQEGHPGGVNNINSLRGACLVQGVFTAKIISEKFSTAKITETHPKALLKVWPKAEGFIQKLGIQCLHQRDAVLSAYCAYALDNCTDWIDLSEQETEGIYYPSGYPAIYWFPERK